MSSSAPVAPRSPTERERLQTSLLFLAEDYARRAGVQPTDALEHFCRAGWRAGVDPSPFFDVQFYLANNPDVEASGQNPLDHYLTAGWSEGRQPHPDFRPELYREAHPGMPAVDPVVDCVLRYGRLDWRRADPVFVLRRTEVFDPAYYLNAYPGVAAAGADPLVHYVVLGADDLRNPSPEFDTWFYRRANPDAPQQGAGALVHYLARGRHEGRAPRPSGSVTLSPTTDQAGPASVEGGLAVHLHLFYPELLPEFVLALRNMPAPYDLYCSVSGEADRAQVEERLAGELDGVTLHVETTPNRGRDIAPFLVGLGSAWSKYDLVCHLHSKRSGHLHFGDQWRRETLNRLFGSPEIVAACLGFMSSNKDCGFLFPENMRYIKSAMNWGERGALEALFRRLELPPPQLPEIPDFAAGSMGWFRPAALERALNAGLGLDEFEPESGQLEGTLAHRFERAFPALVRGAGYQSVSYYLQRCARLPFEP